MILLLANPAKSIGKFLIYSSIPEINCTAAGDNVVIGWRKKISVNPVKLPYQPFDPISGNRVPYFFGDCYTDTRPGKLSVSHNDNEIAQNELSALCCQGSKFGSFPESPGFIEFGH